MTDAAAEPTREPLCLCLIIPVDWPQNGFGPLAPILDQLPEPDSLDPGTRLRVTSEEAPPSSLLKRFNPLRVKKSIHKAILCSALLAKGYRNIEFDEAGAAAQGTTP
jgi:hypothetical protein